MADITFVTVRPHRDMPSLDRRPVLVMFGPRGIGTAAEMTGHGRKAAGNVRQEAMPRGSLRNGGMMDAAIASTAAIGAKNFCEFGGHWSIWMNEPSFSADQWPSDVGSMNVNRVPVRIPQRQRRNRKLRFPQNLPQL